MTVTPKKLIEVALPLDAINKACKDDKDRKTGHIRNLHKWYAPMPLPAWRAALIASVMDDPSSSLPTDMAGAARQKLFEDIQTILPLDAAKSRSLFASARAMLAAQGTKLPVVIDPFCGGGSTILEAQRLGFRTIGIDLNPLPVLITTVLTTFPARFAHIRPVHPKDAAHPELIDSSKQAIVADVTYYARVVADRARTELLPLFPDCPLGDGIKEKSATVMSWLWTRTAVCPNPGCRAETPLASSFELTKATKSSVAQWIEPVVEHSAGIPVVGYRVLDGPAAPPNPVKRGRGARFFCVACEAVIDETLLRSQAAKGGLGFALMAAVVKTASGKRMYLGASAKVLATAAQPAQAWNPDLELSTHPQYMGAPRYGMRTVGDLFLPRQRKTLEVFARIVRELRSEIAHDAAGNAGAQAQDYADAVTTILALCVSKLSQSHNVMVRWKIDSRNGSGKPLPAFDTQTVPIVWDFAENNPFGGSVGDWEKTVVATAMRAFDFVVSDGIPALVFQGDAREAASFVPDGPVLLATDPPYYDNVPYSDLSDIFYPLLRLILRDIYPNLFDTIRPPRHQELIADYSRFGGDRQAAAKYFIEGFCDVLSHLKPHLGSYPATIVYSYKQQEVDTSGTKSTGWETMLQAIMDAGFEITATWPVRTTLENRSRDIDSNALGAAILIVCRPRHADASSATRSEFLQDLSAAMNTALPTLIGSEIAPVDLAQASIGPGMAVYSKHSAVVRQDGAPVTVREALQDINNAISAYRTERTSSFDPKTRFCLDFYDQFGFSEAQFDSATVLARAQAVGVDTLENEHLLVAEAGRAALVPIGSYPVGVHGLERRFGGSAWEACMRLAATLREQGEGPTAALARDLGEGVCARARELAVWLYTIANARKRSQDALAFNALDASWPEIQRLMAAMDRGGQQGRFA